MSVRDDEKEFLSSRRARITPEQAGLPAYGGNRRVPGLRREEVAILAGVSVDYYVRMERGNLSGVSDSVLGAIATALQLDEAGRNPHDRALTDLIGELTTRSPEFTKRWAAHDVRFHRTGHKRIHHPVVGDLDLNFEAMSLASDPNLTMLIYTAEPGNATADALKLLASWEATQDLRLTAP